jgi:serine/threonine protein kinase/Tol biopolymer transport system component
MALAEGDKLGPYEILSPIGKGGMGAVYKARDPRLKRDVAIKVSAAQFTERFEREAHAIAALNHSNICQIYDVGPDYLVMELIDGAPLKGPLPLDRALKYAVLICDALDAAHKKGITHRDLKPSNILVTKNGIKLLDFGLAKFADSGARPATTAPSDETLTMALTGKNEIVGTLFYMSPEQLQTAGRELDSRSDIFSFGLVLYEMLTGKRAFEGSSPASVIAAIMERPAPSIAEVAPSALDRALKKCLAKDPDERWQTAKDLRDELEWIASGAAEAPAVSAQMGRRNWLGWAAAGGATVAFGGLSWFHFRETPPVRQRVRFQISPPEGSLNDLKLSPDGRFLAFCTSKEGVYQIWVRALDSLEIRLLASVSLPARSVCWSADGEYVGFSSALKVYKVARAGGAPVEICQITQEFKGASWRSDGTILLSTTGGLYWVSSAGGAPTKFIDEGTATPAWLKSDRFLFQKERSGIYAGSLTGKETRLLLPDASGPVFAPSSKSGQPDQLFFVRGGTLFVQTIDAEKAELRGTAVLLADRIGTLSNLGKPAFSATPTGVLVFGHDGGSDRELVWLDRKGKKLETVSKSFRQAPNPAIRLSPDDSRAIVPLVVNNSRDLWIADLNRETLSRFTFEESVSGIWSPDGRKVLWTAYGGKRYLRSLDGSGQDELLFTSPSPTGYVEDWSSDGKRITFQTNNGIWMLEIDGDRKPHAYHDSHFNENWNVISPDGQWLAYRSDQPGQYEILVESIPPGKGRFQISTEGGDWPIWRRDGKELFFRQGTKIMAVPIRLTATSVESGKPQPLFDVPANTRFQVSRDGQRFLIAMPVEGSAPDSQLTVDTDWRAALAK